MRICYQALGSCKEVSLQRCNNRILSHSCVQDAHLQIRFINLGQTLTFSPFPKVFGACGATSMEKGTELFPSLTTSLHIASNHSELDFSLDIVLTAAKIRGIFGGCCAISCETLKWLGHGVAF